MKKLTYLMAGCALMLMTSCASYQHTAPVMAIGGNNINTYVEADLDYENAKKVSAEVESKTLFGFISLTRNGNKTVKSNNRYKGLSKIEAQALYRAKNNADVDMILEPEFETEKHSWFLGAYKTKKTKVEGWGINVKGIKEDKRGQGNATTSFGVATLWNN